MIKLENPVMSLDNEIGDAVAQFSDGSLHVFLPDSYNLEIDNEALKSFLDDIKSLTGKFSKEEHKSESKELGNGVYTLDSTLYSSEQCKLNYLQDETYVGASGGTDQLLLEIVAAGMASGVGAELTRRLINLIFGKNEQLEAISDEVYEKVKNILHKHYGAAGEITFLEKNESENLTFIKAEDFRGKQYNVTVNTENGKLSVMVKNPNT